jgi:hypothetical protein
MRLRRLMRRAFAETVEVWRCDTCGGEAGEALWIARRYGARRKSMRASEPTAPHARSDNMRRSTTQRLLDEAEQAIRHCRRHQERQLVIIEKRERVGHDASQARQLLRTLQQLQLEHEANRDRLQAELGNPEAAGQELDTL